MGTFSHHGETSPTRVPAMDQAESGPTNVYLFLPDNSLGQGHSRASSHTHHGHASCAARRGAVLAPRSALTAHSGLLVRESDNIHIPHQLSPPLAIHHQRLSIMLHELLHLLLNSHCLQMFRHPQSSTPALRRYRVALGIPAVPSPLTMLTQRTREP